MEIEPLAEYPGNELPTGHLGATQDCARDRAESTLRLLIIDDEIRHDNPLVRMLEDEGVHVTTAQSGTAGLHYARAGGFNGILLDLKLPDILGMTVLNFIRTERIPIPVIVITGHFLDTDHKHKALEAGAAGFLAKPIFDAAELARMIRQVGPAYVARCDPQPTPALSSAATPGISSPRARRGASSARSREIPGLADLHARTVEGNPDGIDEIVRLLLPALRAWLRRAFPMDAADSINSGVDDALLEYCADQSRYDPERGRSLEDFLYSNARRNVLNRLDSIRRRLKHETTAVAPGFWQNLAASTSDELSARLEQFRDMLVLVRSSLTPEEQIVHDLQMVDEHDTGVYARALHLEHLPWPEQARQVRLRTNAVSHRVRRALLRLRDRLRPPSNGSAVRHTLVARNSTDELTPGTRTDT